MRTEKTVLVVDDAVSECGDSRDFTGHIGGDDFICIGNRESDVLIAKYVLRKFEREKLELFNDQDRLAGFVMAENRENQVQQIPLTGIAIAIIRCKPNKISDPAELAKAAAELKHEVKMMDRSAYLVADE